MPIFSRLQRAGLLIAVLLCLAGIGLAAKRAYDTRLVQGHQQRQDVRDTQATLQADRRAGAADQQAEAAAAARAAALQGATRNAQTQHPDLARRPAGPVSSAALDELRRRRSPPPAR